MKLYYGIELSPKFIASITPTRCGLLGTECMQTYIIRTAYTHEKWPQMFQYFNRRKFGDVASLASRGCCQPHACHLPAVWTDLFNSTFEQLNASKPNLVQLNQFFFHVIFFLFVSPFRLFPRKPRLLLLQFYFSLKIISFHMKCFQYRNYSVVHQVDPQLSSTRPFNKKKNKQYNI